jgi:prolyl 4-hydroxylase
MVERSSGEPGIHVVKPNLIAERVWKIDGLVSFLECRRIITMAEELGFSRAALENAGRLNSESHFQSTEVRTFLIQRLAPLFSIRLRESLEVYRYAKGDCVLTHTDGAETIACDQLSNSTLLIYLNDSFSGGSTVFPGLEVTPVPGCGLLFAHGVLHEARIVNEGVKYVLRVPACAQGPLVQDFPSSAWNR